MNTTQTMHETIVDVNAQLAERVPAQILNVFVDEQRALGVAGVPAGAAGTGTAMPDGDLLDVDGKPTTLAHARGGAAAVVVFYRGLWCH